MASFAKILAICSVLFLQMISEMKGQTVEPVENSFQGTRFVNAHSVNLAENGELLLLIQHRFGDVSGGYYELFGLDQASMRLGFEYGLGDYLNVGIGRSTWLKTFDAFAKAKFLQQTTDFPFSASVTLMGSVPTIRNFFPDEEVGFANKSSASASLQIARTMGRFALQVSPGYIKTGYLNEMNKDLSFFVGGLAASLSVTKKVSVNVEYLLAFKDHIDGENALSLGVDLDTGGHLFQLIFSNNQRMYEQGFYTNTTGKWSSGNIYFGFNLIREFTLKYY